MVDNQLDDINLKLILAPLTNEGYIEESEGMWHILPKGVKYMQTHDRMMLESAEGYLEGRLKDTSENPQERKQESERRWNRKMTVIGVILALLSVLAAYTEPLLERAWQVILSLVIDKWLWYREPWYGSLYCQYRFLTFSYLNILRNTPQS